MAETNSVTVYLDICCLNRPFDDQTQDRIRLESEAVLLILTHIEAGEWQWVGSDVLDVEIDQTPDYERRSRVRLLLSSVHQMLSLTETEIDRAKILEGMGFHSFDALHLACAESGHADVFLTTDDRLLRVAKRNQNSLRIDVRNPLVWLEGMIKE